MIKAQEFRIIIATMGVTLGGALALGYWQTKTLRDDVASLTTKCQFLEGNLEAETERTAQTRITLANAKAELERLRATGEVLSLNLDGTRALMTREPQRYTWNLLHTVKRGFNDIQHHVAAGRFPGLALTDGYMEMKQVINNPAFEEMLARDHGISRRE